MASLPSKPSQDPVWASAPGTDPSSGNSYLMAPSSAKQQLGWVPEKPPLQYFNWWMNIVYQWITFSTYRNPLANIVTVTAPGAISVSLGRSIYIWADTSLGNQTVVLPSPVAVNDDGMIVRVKRLTGGSNTLTFIGTVEGDTNPTLDNQFVETAVIAKGGLWYYIA